MNTLISLSTGLRWYVVQAKPRHEERVHNYLEQNGIKTFLPFMETSSCNPCNVDKKLKPLFPSYLFARFDLEHNYPLVKWGKGVHKILGFGKYPTPIADEVLSLIKSRTDENNVVKKAYNLNNNEPVKIISGPLKDLLGIFDRWVSDSGRVMVLLNLTSAINRKSSCIIPSWKRLVRNVLAGLPVSQFIG